MVYRSKVFSDSEENLKLEIFNIYLRVGTRYYFNVENPVNFWESDRSDASYGTNHNIYSANLKYSISIGSVLSVDYMKPDFMGTLKYIYNFDVCFIGWFVYLKMLFIWQS